MFFFFSETTNTEIYTILFVGSVRCVQETGTWGTGVLKIDRNREDYGKKEQQIYSKKKAQNQNIQDYFINICFSYWDYHVCSQIQIFYYQKSCYTWKSNNEW
eukprot:TRINITY_DN24323_c0_g1_i1.p2 TRINITY_DN24323_c0_g1~~TRINITY_DN24323_c0_g1_i1.p2  ORF type:complete len:102 (+),score=14.04 TRINITY_DN24323_c0_g1_i1:57-362(+)